VLKNCAYAQFLSRDRASRDFFLGIILETLSKVCRMEEKVALFLERSILKVGLFSGILPRTTFLGEHESFIALATDALHPLSVTLW
jgi:hypothetical protein